MEYFKISFGNFVFHAIVGIVIWFIIEWIRNKTENITLRSGKNLPIRTIFLRFEIIAEPVIIIHIIGKLIMINPVYHLFVMIVLIIIFMSSLKNYFNGRVIMYRNLIRNGEKITLNKKEGKIIKRDRLGLTIITNFDRIYISYTELLETGFSLPQKDNNSKFSFIKIKNNSFNESEIFDILINIPYINNSFVPEIILDNKIYTAKILLHENSDIKAVKQLLKEKGIIS